MAKEIRLGSAENMKNINLGSIEIQEVYLGNILVWQNNQAPVYISLSWDGDAFSVPEEFEAVTGTADSNIANGGNSIALVVGGLSDPDNIDPLTDDFIVGYRLQRPDGTWAAGDPDSALNRGDGAPIADFGAILPGTASTWDAVEEEFTAGAETLATSSISVALRETDSDGNIVDSLTQEFEDDGNWILTVVDSRAGESEMATMDITLNYADAAGAIESSITQGGVAAGTNISITAGSPTSFQNATIGGPTNAVLAIESIGGPLSTTVTDIYDWSCVSGCTGTGTGATFSVAIPQDPGGGATPARVTATLRGRAWNTNAASVSDVTDVYFRSGPSCSPSISVGDSSFSFAPDTSPAICLGAAAPSIYSPGCTNSGGGGGCSSFSYTSGTTFTPPSPSCAGLTGAAPTSTVSFSGVTTGAIPGIGVSGSMIYTADTPSASYACSLSGLPPGVRPIDATAFESSATCIDTTPASRAVSVASTPCAVESATIGCSSCIFATGRTGGSVSGTCPSVPKNGSSTTPVSGECGAFSGSAPTFSGGTMTLAPNSVNVGFFNILLNYTGVTRNSNQDTSAIGRINFSCTCTNAISETCTETGTDNLGNGFGHTGSGSDPITGFSTTCFGSAPMQYPASCDCTSTITLGGYGGSQPGPSQSITIS